MESAKLVGFGGPLLLSALFARPGCGIRQLGSSECGVAGQAALGECFLRAPLLGSITGQELCFNSGSKRQRRRFPNPLPRNNLRLRTQECPDTAMELDI